MLRVNRSPRPKPQRIGFGGGCFWCTEAVFQNLLGVIQVMQGFVCSHSLHGSPSEAVLVDFDPLQINLADLIEIHLRTHASHSPHSMRTKYRSAIYVFDSQQEQDSKNILTRLQEEMGKKLVTQVLPFVSFEHADEKYQNYYANNSSNQFCRRYIDPKLETLRRDYAHLCQNQTKV